MKFPRFFLVFVLCGMVTAVTKAADHGKSGGGGDPDAEEQHRAAGSVYVPLDSWVYPALRRLATLGYIPDQVSDAAPWTRAECQRQMEEALTLTRSEEINYVPGASYSEAQRLLADLQTEFSREESTTELRVESIYTRVLGMGGTPLRDSYHFGQTLNNDFGRPYDTGFNNSTGFSSYARSGRFSAYLRGEYQEAPGRGGYSPPVRQFISGTDLNPIQPSQSIAKTSRFEPLEMYAGVQIGFENVTFGKEALWWGPGEDSAFAFSNNAAPLYMLRFDQTRAIVLPGFLSRIGKIHTQIIFGKLAGHLWPSGPYLNAQKITLDVTENLEFGFTRSAIFGGTGHPVTVYSFGQSLFSTSSVDFGPYGSYDPPGDRHSDFDFRWRLPGLRKYVSIYSDSYADDEPNPIDSPRRSAWGPGVYIAQIPKLSRMDLRVETYATWLYQRDYGGRFLYWDGQYHDSYTNDGNLLGSWVGRDARAYVATTTYWFSAKTKIQGQYRQTKAANNFLPGGGTQTDGSILAQWAPNPEWMLSTEVQAERYYVPILGGPRHDAFASLQVTFTPKNWMIR